MSKNFYFVLTYHISHPKVIGLLERARMFETTESLLDFKIRSKLYLSYSEAVKHVHEDINKKIPAIYPDKEKHPLKIISVMNPALTNQSELTQHLHDQFGDVTDHWDEKCCSTIFLTEDLRSERDHQLPSTWMFKYETYYVEDLMELSKNGEYAFNPMNVPFQNFNSTYQ